MVSLEFQNYDSRILVVSILLSDPCIIQNTVFVLLSKTERSICPNVLLFPFSNRTYFIFINSEGAEQPKPFIQPEAAWPLNLKVHRKGQMEGNMVFNSFAGEMAFDHFTDQDWIFVSMKTSLE